MATFRAFSAGGRWFRGNCHTHTLLSDGKADAAQVAQAYRREGYDFVVLTDHGRAQETLAGLGDEPLPGHQRHRAASATAPGRRSDEPHHIVGLGVEQFAGARAGGESDGGVGHPLDRARGRCGGVRPSVLVRA